MSALAGSVADALFIAVEMEKSAIRLYERALLLFPELSETIDALLCDEQTHLTRFESLQNGGVESEEALMLAAHAAGVLHPGGLIAAQRKGAFLSARALLAYAADREREAIRTYEQFAAQYIGDTSAAFSLIAKEERAHLSGLVEQLADGV